MSWHASPAKRPPCFGGSIQVRPPWPPTPRRVPVRWNRRRNRSRRSRRKRQSRRWTARLGPAFADPWMVDFDGFFVGKYIYPTGWQLELKFVIIRLSACCCECVFFRDFWREEFGEESYGLIVSAERLEYIHLGRKADSPTTNHYC